MLKLNQGCFFCQLKSVTITIINGNIPIRCRDNVSIFIKPKMISYFPVPKPKPIPYFSNHHGGYITSPLHLKFFIFLLLPIQHYGKIVTCLKFLKKPRRKWKVMTIVKYTIVYSLSNIRLVYSIKNTR
jgi:hypothetical protein